MIKLHYKCILIILIILEGYWKIDIFKYVIVSILLFICLMSKWY